MVTELTEIQYQKNKLAHKIKIWKNGYLHGLNGKSLQDSSSMTERETARYHLRRFINWLETEDKNC